MVRRDVGHNGHLRAAAHTDELEAGQLDNRHRVRGHVGQLGQQRRTDVAAQKHLAARGLEHLGNQGGGGGLAVRTGHGHNLTGAVFKEQFHLAGDLGARLQGSLQRRLVIYS